MYVTYRGLTFQITEVVKDKSFQLILPDGFSTFHAKMRQVIDRIDFICEMVT